MGAHLFEKVWVDVSTSDLKQPVKWGFCETHVLRVWVTECLTGVNYLAKDMTDTQWNHMCSAGREIIKVLFAFSGLSEHSKHFTLQGIILAFFKKILRSHTHTHTQTHAHIDGCIKGSFLGSSCCPRAFPHVHWGGADDRIPDLVISVWAALPPNLPHIYIQ